MDDEREAAESTQSHQPEEFTEVVVPKENKGEVAKTFKDAPQNLSQAHEGQQEQSTIQTTTESESEADAHDKAVEEEEAEASQHKSFMERLRKREEA